MPFCTRIYVYVYVNNYCSLYLHKKSYSSLYLHTCIHACIHVSIYLSGNPPQKNTVFTFLLVFKVFFVFSPIFFWHLFSCHFWLPLKYLEFAINCIKLQNVSDWRLEIEDSQKNFFNPGLDWRLKIEDSQKNLKIEDSQKNFFNPGLHLKIEDWRFSQKTPSSNLQSSGGTDDPKKKSCGIFILKGKRLPSVYPFHSIPSVRPSIHPIHLPMLSIHPSILSVHLHIYLPSYLFTYLSTYLSANLSSYLSFDPSI